MSISQVLVVVVVVAVVAALAAAVGYLAGLQRARRTPEIAVPDVQAGLDRLSAQMHALERDRAGLQGELHAQVDLLRRETAALATALRRPAVRGRWGELHLRRTVELAGMVPHCDFTEQLGVEDAEGARLRPDLVVHLAGGRSVVVDAKVPLEAFFDATSAVDEDEQQAHLRRHAHQLRRHVDQLSAKSYWRALPDACQFVVLFVPGESFLSAAFEGDDGLLEYAAARNVVIATPTTLIALLRTVAHAWTQESLAETAREIHALGSTLHARLATLSGHFERLGRALGSAVGSYNDAVGSYERRVLVTARRFGELDPSAEELDAPAPITQVTRVR
ncbi:MAG TPA: DNA recombination protein RmuC [Microthrixaceae bacterium]|nr:DNA recombination protein RmuC [Microthrixaceae bacterium]